MRAAVRRRRFGVSPPSAGCTGLGAPFWSLWWLYLASRATTFVVPFLGVYLVSQRDQSVGFAGAALAVVGAGGTLANLVGGRWVDIRGARFTFVVGMLSTAAAIVAMGTAGARPSLLLAAFFLGAAAELFRPAAASLVAQLVLPAERPWAFGILFWAVNLGYSVSAVTGGVLASIDFTLLFVIDAVACFVVGVVGYVLLPPTTSDTRAGTSKTFAPIRDRLFTGYLASWLLYGIVFAQLTTTLPIAMKADGLSNTAVGLVLATNAIGIVVVQPMILVVVRGRPPFAVLTAGVAMTALGASCLIIAQKPWAYGAGVAVWTSGEILVSAVNQGLIAQFAAERVGVYFGAYGVAWGIVFTVAPLAGTQLLRVSHAMLWEVCVACTLAAAVGFDVVRRMVPSRRPAFNVDLGSARRR
jgi:MFS family permease